LAGHGLGVVSGDIRLKIAAGETESTSKAQKP
jgi:hypothetical protein